MNAGATPRAWSLISIAEGRQYGGNTGYADEAGKSYFFDSNVANHKQIGRGDLALVRDRDHLQGLARIEEIRTTDSQKVRKRCPVCDVTGIKERRTMEPRWRCKYGHEFDLPMESMVQVTEYEAVFGDTYIALPAKIPAARLKAAALRPSDQASMEEVTLQGLAGELIRMSPETENLLAQFIQSRSLQGDEADDQHPDDDFVPDPTDRREMIVRSIRQRRGQSGFRSGLIRRYGANCMISGCKLLQLVEAAHIWPYRGEEDNHPGNGLLLRADLHTLFDLDLLGIEPGSLTVRVGTDIADHEYAKFDGTRLIVSNDDRPSDGALRSRWDSYREREG